MSTTCKYITSSTDSKHLVTTDSDHLKWKDGATAQLPNIHTAVRIMIIKQHKTNCYITMKHINHLPYELFSKCGAKRSILQGIYSI
jgi:hypothetical protein